MRRRVPIVQMMLANVLILAHALVPYHHHNKVFKAIISLLDDDAQNRLDHEHDLLSHYDVGDFLVSSQPIVVLFTQGELYGAVEELCVVPTISSTSESVKHCPYYVHGQTDFIVKSVGLRAPPVC